MKFLSRTITFNEKEFREEIARAEVYVEDLREALAEAMEWIERPVATVDDAALFEYFEDKVKRLLSQ